MNASGPHSTSNLRRLLPLAWLLSATLVAAQQKTAPGKFDPGPRHSVVPEKELLITDPAVTQSAAAQYPGELSFGYLMEQMAGREHAGAFTRAWLELWLRDQEVNRDIAPARGKMEELVLLPWREKDEASRAALGLDSEAVWTPDLANAPFKLIAIVNRMDLMAPGVIEQMRAGTEQALNNLAAARGDVFAVAPPNKNRDFTELGEIFRRTSIDTTPQLMPAGRCLPGSPLIPTAIPQLRLSEFITFGPNDNVPGLGPLTPGGYGSSAGPEFFVNGEGRLVYALTDAAGKPFEGGFNVIFEYQLAGRRESGSKVVSGTALEWAVKWHRLGSHDSFGEAYMSDLLALTKRFTDAELPTATGEMPRSFLGQIRTNDGVLDTGREFREFRFVQGTFDRQRLPRLRQVPVSLTPADRFRGEGAENVLALVLKSRNESFKKNIPLSLPASIQPAGETEPLGLLGARALLTGEPLLFRWEVEGVRDKSHVRQFSLQTCTGCHGSHTLCDDGCHLKSSPDGATTMASAFLIKDEEGSPGGEMKERMAVFKTFLTPGDAASRTALVRAMRKRNRSTH